MTKYKVIGRQGSSARIKRIDGPDIERTISAESFRGGEAWFALKEDNVLDEIPGRNLTYELSSIDPAPPGSGSEPDINRNPYNFVRLPGERPWLEEANSRRGKHAGHEIWQPHLLHGHIDLTLTALNPVFSPAWIAKAPDNNDAESTEFYKLHKWEDGETALRCAIPGSSLKGVIRSMVEALSNDRFGALGDPAVYAMKIPYRRRVYQLGEASMENGKWYVSPRVIHATQNRVRYPSNLLWLEAQHRKRRYGLTGGSFLLPNNVRESYNNNLGHPHYQRHLEAAWKRNKPPYETDELTRIMGVPRSTEWKDITDDQKKLAYSKLVEHLRFPADGNVRVEIYFTHCNGEVDSFGRNVNYLWPARWSVAELCGNWFPPSGPERGLTKQLGLAERMFGFVSDHDQHKGSHPFRGKLRFEPVWADPNAVTVPLQGIAKAIAPKSRAKCRPLYLAGIPAGDDTLHSASYSDEERPVFRGRKFYWKQHPPDGEPVWKGHIDNSQAELGIKALPAGTGFTTRIHFDNLSEPELGVLLYALLGVDWQQPQPGDGTISSGVHAIHIGKYKPRGLGACSVRVDSLSLRNPAKEYSSLTGTAPPEPCPAERIEEFRNSFQKWCLQCARADGDKTEHFKDLGHICDFRNLHVFPDKPSVRYYPQNWSQYSWSPYANRNPDEPEPPQLRPKAMQQAGDLDPNT